MGKNSSFSLFLNIVLSLLLLGTLVFSYFFGNFGGISLRELRDSYVLKEDLKFSDLPKLVKESYIKKSALPAHPTPSKDLEKVFDKEGNPIEDVDGSVEDLRSLIKSLQERVLYLEQENMLLSNDKSELLKIVQKEKSSRKIEESNLLTKNLEKINEAEKQHYKNISELTAKINDLQRENISLSQEINTQKEEYEQNVLSLKKEIQKTKDEEKSASNKALRQKIEEYENLAKLNQVNQKKIEELNRLLQTQNNQALMQNAKYEKQITSLQDKINSLILEKNTLLTQNSKHALELEKKSSQKLTKIQESVRRYQEEKKKIQSKYEEVIAKNKQEFNKQLIRLQNQNSDLKEQVEKLNQNNVMILQKSETNLDEKEETYKKLLQSAKEKFQADLKTMEEKNSLLEKESLEAKKTITLLQKERKGQKETIQKNADTILQLNDKITALSKQQEQAKKQSKQILNQNEEKHNKNYKFLNAQIASLEAKLSSLRTQALQNTKNIELKYSQQIQAKTKEYKDLADKFTQIQSEKKSLETKLSALNNEYKTLKVQKENLALNKKDKLLQIEKSFEELKAQVREKEQEYASNMKSLKEHTKDYDLLLKNTKEQESKIAQFKQEIASLKKQIQTYETQVVSSGTLPISDKKRKLALLGQVECDDMNFGNFKVSSTCKKKVNKFLSDFDASNFFEVIPIVGKGGFSSLNKLKREKNANIADSEIDRLTDLANLGLGKHRAKEGGWLIREKFGEFAKISYTVYNIEADNKRGFVIRVYK
jgi:hypothetical protein